MAGPTATDPLDVLEAMFKEVLVQTGKALKASQRDGGRQGASTGTVLRTKMPQTMKTYHYALDDLESEITRAKAVLLRDLEKLQAAKAPPVPAPQPVAPPAPMMPEPRQPTAVMMDMPSAAAHTVIPNTMPPKEESTKAPFPDMGMGLSGDVVDLTSNDKPPRASPLVPAGTTKPPVGAQATPPVKQSPQAPPPSKANAVPPQPTTTGLTAQKAIAPTQATSVGQAAQDSSLGAMLSLPVTGGAATADMTGGEFTNMEFSLASATDGPSQNAPPAPMQDFDMSTFTAQDGGVDLPPLDNLQAGSGQANPAASTTSAVPEKPADTTAAGDTHMDSMYDLGGNGEGMELDLSLEDASGVNDSTFDDLFFDDNTDADMGQFDNAYFGLE